MRARLIGIFSALTFAVLVTFGCKSVYPPNLVSARPPSLFDTIVEVPRSRQVPLGISFHEARLKTVESWNDPSPEAVAKARAKNPERRHYVGFRFHYENPDWARRKVTISATLLSENGAVLGHDTHESTLDAKTREDTITAWMRVRTADWGEATRLRVSAAFVE